GLLLMLLYFSYFSYMVLSMKSRQDDGEEEEQEEDQDEEEEGNGGLLGNLFYWVSGGPILDLERWFVRDHQQQQIKSETWNAWPLLLTATALIGLACWLLVRACEWLGTGPGNEMQPHYELFGYQLAGLGMPAMFVAVIFASMATSVPDTVISIRDAQDGDYDDAVANALGSNVFDICFALGFPLFLYTLFNGAITVPEQVAVQSAELRLLLLILTIVGFFVYFIGKRGIDSEGNKYIEMKRGKAALLLLIYVLFVLFIVGRSQQWSWSDQLSSWLQSVLADLRLTS
ncbi:MAG: sodium:calcium antiporter, partial [Pirellulales bacterium]|nr:sodium:calcium antiporter [Pirellulales bacterium]